MPNPFYPYFNHVVYVNECFANHFTIWNSLPTIILPDHLSFNDYDMNVTLYAWYMYDLNVCVIHCIHCMRDTGMIRMYAWYIVCVIHVWYECYIVCVIHVLLTVIIATAFIMILYFSGLIPIYSVWLPDYIRQDSSLYKTTLFGHSLKYWTSISWDSVIRSWINMLCLGFYSGSLRHIHNSDSIPWQSGYISSVLRQHNKLLGSYSYEIGYYFKN